MTSQLLLDKADLELTLEDSQDKDNESADNIASYHDCLVGSYMSYLKAAGYSKISHEILVFEQGARLNLRCSVVCCPIQVPEIQ